MAKVGHCITAASQRQARPCCVSTCCRLGSVFASSTVRVICRSETSTIDVAVTVDSTWAKRGFTSNFGVVPAMSVDTGEIIDVAVMSKYCDECANWSWLRQDAFTQWKAEHVAHCDQNHAESSPAMEMRAAVLMWGRSLQLHNLRYRYYVSDGDSKGFSAVNELNPYDDLVVEKIDCVNHVGKRMGTGLVWMAHRSSHLPSHFLPHLLPLFDCLSKPALLEGCLPGLTQNQNEAFNHILWQRYPKDRFFGSKAMHATSALERGCVITGSDDGCDEHSRWCSHCARQRQEGHKAAAQLLQNQLRAGEATAQGHQAREAYN